MMDCAPDGLMVDLLAGDKVEGITDPTPKLGWIVRSPACNDVQTAYRVLVASQREGLDAGRADMWDSGEVASDASINVAYGGRSLAPGRTYHWKVKTWGRESGESRWSRAQAFVTAERLGGHWTPGHAVVTRELAPRSFVKKGRGHYFIDFGRAAAGTVRLALTGSTDDAVVNVHLGERTSGAHTVDREPGGSIRYAAIEVPVQRGAHEYRVEVPAHRTGHGERTLAMPDHVGEVMPFRYCEVSGVPGEFTAEDIRQIAVHYPFDERAASFSSSDETLDRVWELCRYSIKATSYCGLYIDGDRERFPREADSYINQISHYGVDREYALARRTHEFMMTHTSQWTEWMMHSVIMAWTDYLYTGNAASLEHYYEDLKHKTLVALAREDGLISTRTGLVDDALRRALHYYEGAHVKGPDIVDIVDWPAGERDGYVFGDYNTVVNAFHHRALVLMSSIAGALGRDDDAGAFADRAARVRASFNEAFFDVGRGVYVDGEGVEHASLHANMFAMALGLTPEDRRESVAGFIRSRGMACSVYGAQYLLEALYAAGEDAYALELMTSQSTRSWHHMLEVGSTITMEAWDLRFKRNLDWTHAWGAAPANVIPRYVLGVRPREPGFARAWVQPRPGALERATGEVPTIRGPVGVSFENREAFALTVAIPANMTATVGLPRRDGSAAALEVDGEEVAAVSRDGYLFVEGIGSGRHTLIAR